MGIKGLWPLLNNGGGVESLSGDASAAKIAEIVDGKSIAVDLSVWMCQAENMGNSAYASQVSSETRVMKLVFERACNWLRFGCIPVAVLEGELPEAKRAAQRTRFKHRTGKAGGGFGSSASWTSLARDIGKMFRAMGLSVVQAPGEAEATCGALNAAGLVDGVATVDGDALLFGASVVYKELGLSTSQPKACSLARCSIEAVRSRLGISSGGGDALIAVAALSGGDYNEAGTKGVGPLKALKLLTSLLEASPGSSDDGVLQALLERLGTGPDDSLAALTKCTGCKACGHDNGSAGKKCTKARGCVGCGTHPVGEGGDGSGGCRPRGSEPLSSTCRCPFHRLWLERHLDKIVRQVGSQPRYAAAIQQTASEYQRQLRMAAEKAERVKADMADQRRRRPEREGAATGGHPAFEWRARPDIASLEMTLGRVTGWTASTIRKKVLPVLLEWDVAHQQGAELVVRSVVKVSGNQGEECPSSWRYLLDVESRERPGPACFPLPQSDAAKKSKAPGSGAATAPQPEQQAAAELVTEWEFDRSCLQEPLARSVRMSSVKRHLPELVEAFHLRAKEKAAAAKEKQPSQRRRAKPSGSTNSRPITEFFAVVKAPARAEPLLRESRVTSNAPSNSNPDAGSPPKKQKMPVPLAATSLPDGEEPCNDGRGHAVANGAGSRICKNTIEDLPRSRLFEESFSAGQYPGSDPLLDSPPPAARSPTTEEICTFRRGHTAATAAETRIHKDIPRSKLFGETLAAGQCPGGDPLLDSPTPAAPSPTCEEICTFRRGHTAATGAESRIQKQNKAEDLLMPRSRLFEETLAAGQYPGGDPLLDSPTSKAGASGRQMAAGDQRIGSARGAQQPVVLSAGTDDSDTDGDPSVIDLTQSTPPIAKALSSAAAADDVIVLS